MYVAQQPMRRQADSSHMLIPDAGSRLWPQVEHSEQRGPRSHANLTAQEPGLLRPASEANRRRRASTPRSCLNKRQARLFVAGPAVWLRRPRAGSRWTARTTQALSCRHKRPVYSSPSSSARTERRRRWQGHSRQPSTTTILGDRKATSAELASTATSSEHQCLSRRLTWSASPRGAEPADWLSEPRRRRPAGRGRRFGTRTRHQRRE